MVLIRMMNVIKMSLFCPNKKEECIFLTDILITRFRVVRTEVENILVF